ncbi:MAG: hypothetical protein J6Q10_02995 [Clostridia bacterium]|nr:hypothetical protein [Clostridia bacterium]
MSRLLWCYCDKCGNRIEVGDTCYDIGSDTYCSACVKPRNAMWEWERRCEAEEGGEAE